MKWWIILKCWLLHRFNEIIRDTATHAAMPGIYVREYYSGALPVKEIMTVTRLSVLSDLYQVERRVGPRGPEDASRGAVRQDKWIAAYHAPTRQLVQDIDRKVCSFVPEQNLLFFGDREYHRTAESAQ